MIDARNMIPVQWRQPRSLPGPDTRGRRQEAGGSPPATRTPHKMYFITEKKRVMRCGVGDNPEAINRMVCVGMMNTEMLKNN